MGISYSPRTEGWYDENVRGLPPSVSEADAYPMPRIDDLLESTNYISTMVSTRGYRQVPVAQESHPKTAFMTPFRLFDFTVMPFGLYGAPATFQMMMDTLLRGAENYALHSLSLI